MLRYSIRLLAFLLASLPWLAGCRPNAPVHVAGYLVERQLSGIWRAPAAPPATLVGVVYHEGKAVEGVTVLVAERTGEPHAARTDARGRYRIEGIPPGQYVPAAVGPGFEEMVPRGTLDIPLLVTLTPGGVTRAPPIHMRRHEAAPLPAPLPEAAQVTVGASVPVTAPFPIGAAASVRSFTFERAGVQVDSLRLYRPPAAGPAGLPLLFALYPGEVDNWEPVSVALASAGYTVLALSPAGARGLDVAAHAEDARLALALALGGHLGPDLADVPAVALGGSFTSAILHRVLRDEGDHFAAWVTLGGVSNAFDISADFYAGRIVLPAEYGLLIPALGPANLYPLSLLRYAPVYTAGQLPPTLVIHTDVDIIIPIEQAYELEAALRAARVAVEVFYYEDVSHYLQIGEDLTPEGEAMYWLVLEFIATHVGNGD